ncbi:hypothetical protein P43SY_004103 [Pythium insidiosum]|uniref:Roadblock/LAMTOR2 domain-containing protein n=1 Tax=Pythium insidiosum TaxID=114742 RepID=A0AAD5QBE1_PYTIN|nr:hypothetical protein P43SY_004103 [Pythium insidiosum]
MLRARALPEVLGQIVGDGIDASMLLTLEGALMGSVGSDTAAPPVSTGGVTVDHKVIGAIAAHTWSEYFHSGREFHPDQDLDALLVELEHGHLAMAPAGKSFIVCAYSHSRIPTGLLKAKVQALGSYLSTSLDLIQV